MLGTVPKLERPQIPYFTGMFMRSTKDIAHTKISCHHSADVWKFRDVYVREFFDDYKKLSRGSVPTVTQSMTDPWGRATIKP